MENNRKRFVLIHKYLETGHVSIVAFSNRRIELASIRDSHPCFGSLYHFFSILPNINITLFNNCDLGSIKDECLINLCKNVAEYLSVAEYAMLKKSYFKSASWFEKAKNSAFLGADIIENY